MANSGLQKLSFNMEEDEFIGEKTFQHYCAEFIKHSQQIGDSWEWRPSKDCSDGYMCKIHFQIKSGSVMSHPGASTHGQTCPPMEIPSGRILHAGLLGGCFVLRMSSVV
uniref:Autophagy related 10 n=1 Tax=Papio anubis TaxID=9555 RepID=A0A8I5NNL4_PAPAN